MFRLSSFLKKTLSFFKEILSFLKETLALSLRRRSESGHPHPDIISEVVAEGFCWGYIPEIEIRPISTGYSGFYEEDSGDWNNEQTLCAQSVARMT